MPAIEFILVLDYVSAGGAIKFHSFAFFLMESIAAIRQRPIDSAVPAGIRGTKPTQLILGVFKL